MHKDKNPVLFHAFLLQVYCYEHFQVSVLLQDPTNGRILSYHQPHLAEGILKQEVAAAMHPGRATCFWRCAPSNRLPVPACPAVPPYTAKMVTVWWSATVTHRCRLTPWDPQPLHSSTHELTWAHWKHWIPVPSEIWASCQILNKS